MGCVFLYNPQSGRGKIEKKVPAIVRRLSESFGGVEVFRTASGGEMAARVREWAGRCDAVIFAGGDGTFNAVLQAAAGSDVTLGYLPAGTVNDAAGNLGIPKNVRRALNVIGKKRTAKVDCLQINAKRYAFCLAAAGSLTRVTYETPQAEKRRFGRLAYAFEAVRRVRRMKPFFAEVRCGTACVSGEFALALVLNGSRLARFPVNRGSSLRDGRCETLLVRQSGRPLRAAWAIARLLLLGARHGGKTVVRMQGERVRISKTDSVLWDFDGERGFHGEIDARVLHGAVKIFVPK